MKNIDDDSYQELNLPCNVSPLLETQIMVQTLMRKPKIHVSSYISNLGSVIDDETKHFITYG